MLYTITTTQRTFDIDTQAPDTLAWSEWIRASKLAEQLGPEERVLDIDSRHFNSKTEQAHSDEEIDIDHSPDIDLDTPDSLDAAQDD